MLPYLYFKLPHFVHYSSSLSYASKKQNNIEYELDFAISERKSCGEYKDPG